MSHELRTPLNAIAGHVTLVVDGIHGPLTDSQRDALERAQRAQRHLLGLVDDVLNFARLEHGRMEYTLRAVALGEIVRDVVRMVEPQFAARGIGLRNDVPAVAPVNVHADAEKIRQILLNLLSNAVKFTKPGGRVVVALANEGRAENGAVTLLVHDTGIGIAREQLQTIFEPFVKLNRTLAMPVDGAGLGLAISSELARGMGGDLVVQSTPGAGSTFALTLPAGLGR
jgi:signal transduction histidine kinase